jgi:ATP-binding cassette subfamily B multidrug efflux pump
MYTDFGYMEEGRLGKPYDLKLMLRLGRFLGPYWSLIAFSLFFVLIMAGLDLLIPYLTKEAIDRYIVVSAREVVLKGDNSPEERRFLSQYGQKFIPEKEKGRFLLPPDVLQSMDRKEMTLFEKYGLLTENRYYLFTPTPQEEAIIKRYPSFFWKSGSYWFISVDRMKDLKREDLLVLRGRDIKGVFRIGLLVIFILVINFGLNFSQVYAMELAGQRMMHDLRMKVFSHLEELPVSFFDKNPVGRLVTRLTNDIQNVHEMFTSVLVNLLKDVLLVIGIIILLLELNRPLALVSFSIIPLIFVATLFFSRQARDAFREIRLRIAQMNSFFHENFSGIRVVQLFRREKESSRRYEKINEEYYLANMKQVSIYAFFVPLVEILSSGAVGLLLWYGGGEVIQGMITLGVLVAFLSYIRMFFQPIRDLSEKYNVLQSAMASLERIFSLLDQNQKISERVRPFDKLRATSTVEWLGTKPLLPRKEEIKGNIDFSHVSFSYNGEDQVLNDVSFSVREGETVAIVGATGAGKTSLLHLLEGFYDVEEGAILVDGTDIREMDLTHLRSQIGLVMQDTFLFSGDIRENIRMGNMKIGDQKVREVAGGVNAEKFIQRLPEGYGTRVGEGGEMLSAGERQLLAFARALSINPKVLILDEATSHVDPETERLIQEGLSRLLKGRTAIVIAHRLSTIQHADRIVVLHKGRIREIGSHAELMALKGIYFRLYQMQFGAASNAE